MITQINDLKKEIGSLVEQRISDFEKVNSSNNSKWFSELCFCILTANTSAQMGLKFQSLVGEKNFLNMPHAELLHLLKSNGCRFHNMRAGFIVEARKFKDIKNIILKLQKEKSEREIRNWLAENVKGIGYKEASHFMRNVGFQNVAILDKHILNLLVENNLLKEKPKLNKKTYQEIESMLDSLAKKAKLDHARLDLYMWYMKTGKVLK